MQSALNALATIGGVGGSVSVSGGPAASSPYVITFAGTLASGDVPMLEVDEPGQPNPRYTRSGGGPEVCKPASGDHCQAGSPDSSPGGFSETPQPCFSACWHGSVGGRCRGGALGNWAVGRLERFDPGGGFVSQLELPGAGQVETLGVFESLGETGFYLVSAGVAGVQRLDGLGMAAGSPYPLDGVADPTTGGSGDPRALASTAGGVLIVSDQPELTPRPNRSFWPGDVSRI